MTIKVSLGDLQESARQNPMNHTLSVLTAARAGGSVPKAGDKTATAEEKQHKMRKTKCEQKEN